MNGGRVLGRFVDGEAFYRFNALSHVTDDRRMLGDPSRREARRASFARRIFGPRTHRGPGASRGRLHTGHTA